MLKDRYIFCYKNVRMRTTKNLCMRKFRNLNFRNRHVPKHWHTNFHEIPRDSWIFSLYVGKFHHLSATCRLMIVMNFAQIVIFYLHKILKPKIFYSKLIGTNMNKKRSQISCWHYFRKLIYISILKKTSNDKFIIRGFFKNGDIYIESKKQSCAWPSGTQIRSYFSIYFLESGDIGVLVKFLVTLRKL